MSFKTIFIIIVSVLVTIILMNNTDEIQFWIFGNAQIPKLAILGFMFGLGAIVGYMAGRPKSKSRDEDNFSDEESDYQDKNSDLNQRNLSDDDREYIS